MNLAKRFDHRPNRPEPVPPLSIFNGNSRPAIEQMSDPDIEKELRDTLSNCTSQQAVLIQGELRERAFIIGWKGSPMEMAAEICLAAVRKIKDGGVR
jgi:hypothetical protein